MVTIRTPGRARAKRGAERLGRAPSRLEPVALGLPACRLRPRRVAFRRDGEIGALEAVALGPEARHLRQEAFPLDAPALPGVPDHPGAASGR
jgi:hypothetical protein